LCFPDGLPDDSDDSTEPISDPPPGYASIRSSDDGSYVCQLLLNNAWRSPALAAYAAAPTAANLKAVKAVAKAAPMECEDDEKIFTISPDTFSYAWVTRDDHGYGGAIIISSKLSKAEAQAKIKADMERAIAKVNTSDW
jgi:hypothetical protein